MLDASQVTDTYLLPLPRPISRVMVLWSLRRSCFRPGSPGWAALVASVRPVVHARAVQQVQLSGHGDAGLSGRTIRAGSAQPEAPAAAGGMMDRDRRRPRLEGSALHAQRGRDVPAGSSAKVQRS